MWQRQRALKVVVEIKLPSPPKCVVRLKKVIVVVLACRKSMI